MVRVETPDTLIGVGEGGSRVVYRFMQQKWILEQVLENIEGGDKAGNLSAVTIDSATSDGFHGEKAKEVQDKIDETIEASEHTKKDRHLEFHGPKIIPEMIPSEWKGANLTSPAVQDLAEHPDNELHSWWLEDGRKPLETIKKDGFGGGVQRLRSMSKALYHISNYTEADLLPTKLGDDVCIVATLGGGTGSGMFLDLASNIAEDANVHFFGILPRQGKGKRESTNANAALSEIEFAELTGDSPFASVTLLPYISSIQHDNKEFEMAVVRSILAQQQMRPHDEYTELLPGDEEGSKAPEFAPFQVAIPHTLKFDMKVIEDSKSELNDYLEHKEEELEKEADLYEVVKEYLNNEPFKGTSVEETLKGNRSGDMSYRDGQGMKEAIRLRNRIEEDILGTLLSQTAIEVAIDSELLDNIKNVFDKILDDENYDYSEDATTGEMAATFIENAPDRLSKEISSPEFSEYGEAAGRPYKLLQVIEMELNNIMERRDVWKAASEITSEIDTLQEIDAELIRRGLLDVTLDSEQTYLSSAITKPTVKDRVSNLTAEKDSLQQKESEIEEFWSDICEHIRDCKSDWDEEVNDDAETLANINKNKETVIAALEDIQDSITSKVNAIERADSKEEVNGIKLSFAALSPFGGDEVDGGIDEIESIGQLNNRLAGMCVEKIPEDELRKRFDHLKKAKSLKLEHNTWGTIGRVDNSEEFSTQAEMAMRNNWISFSSSDSLNVEKDFKPRFNSQALSIEADISNTQQTSIDNIIESFENNFLDDNDKLVSFSEHNIDIPRGVTAREVKNELREGLENTDQTDINDLLNDVLPVDQIDSRNISTEGIDKSDSNNGTIVKLADGYLDPIAEYYREEVLGRLEEIQGPEEDNPGIIYRLNQLIGLAEGGESVPVRVPQNYATDPSNEETYGYHFAKIYEGSHEIEIDREIDSEESPYTTVEETDEKYTLDSPEHIGETNIEGDDIIGKKFSAATKSIFHLEEQAPFNELELKGLGEDVGAEYPYLRVRQAYMSRAFDEGKSATSFYDDVHQLYLDNLSKAEESDVYGAKKFPHGWDDDVTMVTFIGGVFLDNLSVMTGKGGYCETYNESMGENSFMGSQHTIGMGGRWSQWSGIKTEAVSESYDDLEVGEYGAWVYRSETREPSREFVEELLKRYQNDQESAKDLFYDMIEVEAYLSTLQHKIDLS